MRSGNNSKPDWNACVGRPAGLSDAARWLAGGLAALAFVGVVLLGPGQAPAQQQFELSEEGWQKQPTPPADSPEGKLRTIRQRIVEGQPGKAESLARKWLEQYPGQGQRAEARLLLGDALVAQREFYDALTHYELLIRKYPESDQFQTALRREFHIAKQFVNGLNRKFLGLRLLPAEGEGEEILIRIQERAPGSRIGERASLALADYYFRNGQMELAATAYDLFLLNYPDSLKRQWAMQRLIEASLARFGGPPYDPTGLLEARQRLDTFVNEFPAAAERLGAKSLRVRINESLARHEFRTAEWYQGQGKDRAAVILYRRIVQAYPQTAAARTALDRVQQLQTPLMDVAALRTGEDSPLEAETEPTPDEGEVGEDAPTEPAEEPITPRPTEPGEPGQPGAPPLPAPHPKETTP
jgi:outer membrane assembly lipoprotein YfiO